jgi:hypothetical protein
MEVDGNPIELDIGLSSAADEEERNCEIMFGNRE